MYSVILFELAAIGQGRDEECPTGQHQGGKDCVGIDGYRVRVMGNYCEIQVWGLRIGVGMNRWGKEVVER